MNDWRDNILTQMEKQRDPEAISAVEECQRIVRVANPALVAMAAVTYYPGFRKVDDRFSSWLHAVFQSGILPGLADAVHWGSEGKSRELVECDGQILKNTSELHRNGSGRAGRLLLREGVPAGVKCLQRLRSAVEDGTATAHLATVFGARCGVFSIGQRAAALAYVYLELRTGAPDWDDRRIAEKLADANEVISAFFDRKMRSNTESTPIFKRMHG